MKVRLGFVSNSSSSSFVCDLCGETFGGRDLSPSDVYHCDCENGHTICRDGIVGELLEEDDYYEIPASNCPFCLFLNFTDYDVKRYLEAKYKVDQKVVFEEVKQLNKRRKKLYDPEYNDYVYRNFNTSSVVEEDAIKSQFKTFDEFQNWVKGDN